MNKTFYLIILILCFNLRVTSQVTNDYENYKLLYSKENQVELNSSSIIEIKVKNGALNIIEKTNTEKIFLNSTVKFQSKASLDYNDFYTIKDVKASSFNLIDGKYKEFKVSDFKEKDEIQSDAFFDDRKSINFYYNGLDLGSKTKLSYTTEIHDPRFLGAYYLGNFHPIENYSLTIIADKNIEIGFIEMYTDTHNITFNKSTKGNKVIYEWSKKKIKSYPNSNDAISFRYRIPHIIPHIKYYTTSKSDTTYILNSLSDLYSWYQSLVKNTNKQECKPEIKELVSSLTKGLNSDLEKAKAIYTWTQQNIKYIAFENGLGGFIPRDANEVFEKKYGDCKDNSSLLYQMLKEAGINGYLTWIGTRKLPYKYNEVYTPVADNHMILTFFIEDKPYFLDATGRYLDVDLPSAFIQGKEALVGISPNEYKVIEVPTVKNVKNYIKDVTTIQLDSNNYIIGNSTRSYNGYEKTNLFNLLERIKKEDQLKEYYKNILEKGNNNFLLNRFSEKNKFSYDKPFEIDFDFTLKNHASKSGNKLFINLNLNQVDIESIKKSPPYKNMIDYSHKFSVNYTTTFILPKGYEVEYIPSNFDESNDLVDVKINYTLDNNKIVYTHIVNTKFLTLTVNQIRELNEFLKKVQRNFKEVVVLKAK